MNNSNPERIKIPRPYADVLADLSLELDPAGLTEVLNDLHGMADCEVPGIGFEQRGDSREYPIGKITVPIGNSVFTISHVLDIEWRAPLSDGRGVIVQAEADTTGNRHPKLLVIDCPEAGKRPGGTVRSLTDEEAVGWLEQFLDDLGQVKELINQFWYTPRIPKDPPRVLKCIGGVWWPVEG